MVVSSNESNANYDVGWFALQSLTFFSQILWTRLQIIDLSFKFISVESNNLRQQGNTHFWVETVCSVLLCRSAWELFLYFTNVSSYQIQILLFRPMKNKSVFDILVTVCLLIYLLVGWHFYDCPLIWLLKICEPDIQYTQNKIFSLRLTKYVMMT